MSRRCPDSPLSSWTLLALAVVAACGAPEVVSAPPPAAPVAPAKPAEPAPPELAFADEPFRAHMPAVPTPTVAELPQPQVFKLPNGVEVVLVERHQLPTVSLELTFDGGSIDDPPGKEGLAATCMALLAEGTQALDKIAFHEALADMASQVSSYASQDQQGVQLSSLSRHVDKTLDLWADALLRPGLRQDELDRLVKRSIAGLQQLKGNPQAIASRLLPSVAYGPQHPLGRIATEASYAALRLDDCKAYVKRLRPQGARLYAVGDLTRAQLEDKVGSRLAAWKGKAPKPTAGPKPAPRKGKVFFVDTPGAQQAVVMLLHPGPKRTAADYHDTAIMATILGGGFSSRINMNIREKHGYAYGASGHFNYRRTGSDFVAAASVRNDAAAPSIREILREMQGMRDEPVTAEELEREKQGAILGLPARFATGRSILSTFRALLYFGLPLDEYTRFVANVRAVDAGRAQAAARQHVQPDAVRVLVVGDGAAVRPQLDQLVAADGALAGGEIVALDADGQVLPAP